MTELTRAIMARTCQRDGSMSPEVPFQSSARCTRARASPTQLAIVPPGPLALETMEDGLVAVNPKDEPTRKPPSYAEALIQGKTPRKKPPKAKLIPAPTQRPPLLQCTLSKKPGRVDNKKQIPVGTRAYDGWHQSSLLMKPREGGAIELDLQDRTLKEEMDRARAEGLFDRAWKSKVAKQGRGRFVPDTVVPELEPIRAKPGVGEFLPRIWAEPKSNRSRGPVVIASNIPQGRKGNREAGRLRREIASTPRSDHRGDSKLHNVKRGNSPTDPVNDPPGAGVLEPKLSQLKKGESKSDIPRSQSASWTPQVEDPRVYVGPCEVGTPKLDLTSGTPKVESPKVDAKPSKGTPELNLASLTPQVEGPKVDARHVIGESETTSSPTHVAPIVDSPLDDAVRSNTFQMKGSKLDRILERLTGGLYQAPRAPQKQEPVKENSLSNSEIKAVECAPVGPEVDPPAVGVTREEPEPKTTSNSQGGMNKEGTPREEYINLKLAFFPKLEPSSDHGNSDDVGNETPHTSRAHTLTSTPVKSKLKGRKGGYRHLNNPPPPLNFEEEQGPHNMDSQPTHKKRPHPDTHTEIPHPQAATCSYNIGDQESDSSDDWGEEFDSIASGWVEPAYTGRVSPEPERAGEVLATLWSRHEELVKAQGGGGVQPMKTNPILHVDGSDNEAVGPGGEEAREDQLSGATRGGGHAYPIPSLSPNPSASLTPSTNPNPGPRG